MPFLGDLMRMIGQQGAVSWDGARQLALSIATGGESEPNVDPMARISFEQLARVAEIRVGAATGLPTSTTDARTAGDDTIDLRMSSAITCSTDGSTASSRHTR